MITIDLSEVSALAPHVQPGSREPVILTHGGQAVAAVFPASEEDIEDLLLSANASSKRSWSVRNDASNRRAALAARKCGASSELPGRDCPGIERMNRNSRAKTSKKPGQPNPGLSPAVPPAARQSTWSLHSFPAALRRCMDGRQGQ